VGQRLLLPPRANHITGRRGELSLTKAKPAKSPLYPSRWTNAASGHVDEGETYETSAPRELQEEVGISAPLKFLGKILIQRKENDKTFNQFNGVFTGTIPHDTKFSLQADEVSEVRWFTPNELKEKITAAPDDFTPAMVIAVEKFYAA